MSGYILWPVYMVMLLSIFDRLYRRDESASHIDVPSIPERLSFRAQ